MGQLRLAIRILRGFVQRCAFFGFFQGVLRVNAAGILLLLVMITRSYVLIDLIRSQLFI